MWLVKLHACKKTCLLHNCVACHTIGCWPTVLYVAMKEAPSGAYAGSSYAVSKRKPVVWITQSASLALTLPMIVLHDVSVLPCPSAPDARVANKAIDLVTALVSCATTCTSLLLDVLMSACSACLRTTTRQSDCRHTEDKGQIFK